MVASIKYSILFAENDSAAFGMMYLRNRFLYLKNIAEFPTSRTELNAVFDIFDRHRTGEINYSEFMEALRPERQVGL